MFVQLDPFLEIHDAISKIIPKHLCVDITLKIFTLVYIISKVCYYKAPYGVVYSQKDN